MKPFDLSDDLKWVGVERKDGFPIETSYFKTIFDEQESAKEAILHISANTRYCLYVNGAELLHGPCRGDHWHHYCDGIDVAPYLKPGKNIIAVKVTAYPPFETTNENENNFGPIWAMSPHTGPMLMVWSKWESGVDISTGRADWYYCNDSAIQWHQQSYAHWMGCTEEVNGAKIPWGWQTDTAVHPNFTLAKTKWGNAVQYGQVRPLFLYDRPIKQLLRKEINDLSVLTHSEGFSVTASPVVLPAHGNYEAVIATERLTTSFVYLRCKGGAGSTIWLLYAEAFSKSEGRQRYKENRSDTTGELAGVADIYHPGGGMEEYSPSWLRTFRFIKISIKTDDTPLELYPLKMVESRYPIENKVSFSTKQSWAQKVWDISLRTLELCMRET